MSLNEQFMQLLPELIKKNYNDLSILRECLMDFKGAGMDKDSMIMSLELLRNRCDSKTEDILLVLLDFVTGYCNPNLAVF